MPKNKMNCFQIENDSEQVSLITCKGSERSSVLFLQKKKK